MRIAHCADLHLGFRQYNRTTPEGVNQREHDVAEAFRLTVDGVIAARPDVILIAGDLFHMVRPTNLTIIAAYDQFQRIRTALPDVPVIVIAGNHETPKSSDVGSILPLFQRIGVHFIGGSPRRLTFPELDLSVLGVPELALYAKPDLRPEGPERYQVLLLHGEVDGVIRGTRPRDHTLPPERLTAHPWNYVALGHYHVQHEVAPRVWYAGAIDYTSSNPWGELADEAKRGIQGKAWLLADLAKGTVTRMSIPSVRTVFNVPPIAAEGLTASEVDRLIKEAVAAVPGGLRDAVVRVVITDIPRHISRELDHATLRRYKAEALHFGMTPTPPAETVEVGFLHQRDETGRQLTVQELFIKFLEKRELPPGVCRERLKEAAKEALAEVDDRFVMNDADLRHVDAA